MTKDSTRDESNLLDGGTLPLDSHVEGPKAPYGEPKGPLPGSIFAHGKTEKRPLDRDRDGFVGGADVVGKGDQVGSGPEETDRPGPGAQANDSSTMAYRQPASGGPDASPGSVEPKPAENSPKKA